MICREIHEAHYISRVVTVVYFIVLNRFVYLIPLINQSLKCREESLISSNCHQDVFQRIDLMSNHPTEELSQIFNKRDVALRREIVIICGI